MRLFVALAMPPAALADVAGLIEQARRLGQMEQDLVPPRLRWIPAERMHITLAFLGEVSAHRLEPLSIRLARAAAQAQPRRSQLARKPHMATPLCAWPLGKQGLGGSTGRMTRMRGSSGRRIMKTCLMTLLM